MTTTPRAKKAKAGEPEIVELPDRKVAVVTSIGSPDVVADQVFPALYGAVYTLKFTRKKTGESDFKVGPLAAKWPDAHLVPKDQWTGHWALPVPEDTTDIPAKVPDPPVKLETWHYGTVAQILHLGPYDQEGPNIQRLHAFIAEQGYEIAGEHEEVYLTTPRAKVMKTVIRYPIRPIQKSQS